MMTKKFCSKFVFVSLLFVAMLFGCTVAPASSKPVVSIGSPPNGAQVPLGQEVLVQAIAVDTVGIARVELWVDGLLSAVVQPPSPQASYSGVLRWTPTTPGAHTLIAKAVNTSSITSDPAVVALTVVSSNTPTSPPTVPAPPTNAPPTVAPVTPGACTNDSVFVEHVTVPDGTNWMPGQSFNKIWRIRNTGTCAWSSGYEFAFVGGEAMMTKNAISGSAVSPGDTVDILLAMTAPTAPGAHSGQWRMRSPTAGLFGATMNVSINVLGSGQLPGGCAGAPVIASFDANPTTINPGQSSTLSWGKVDNANNAVIDQGIGGVPTPGNTNVNPNKTTTYTLTATGCGGIVTKQVTIIVSSAAPSLTFDYSPKTLAGGDYVTLTFSAPVAAPTIRLGNTALVKMLGTADYKVWKALIPGPAVSDYLYVDYDGKTIKSAQPLIVTSSPAPKIADLAVTKIGPVSTTRADKVYVDIKNTGTADIDSNVHVKCVAMGRMRSNPSMIVPTGSDETIHISLSKGGTGFFWPSMVIDASIYSYEQVICVVTLDGDPTPDDNSMTITIP